jgi:hypothetical protein
MVSKFGKVRDQINFAELLKFEGGRGILTLWTHYIFGSKRKAITAIFRHDYARVCVLVELQLLEIWRGKNCINRTYSALLRHFSQGYEKRLSQLRHFCQSVRMITFRLTLERFARNLVFEVFFRKSL